MIGHYMKWQITRRIVCEVNESVSNGLLMPEEYITKAPVSIASFGMTIIDSTLVFYTCWVNPCLEWMRVWFCLCWCLTNPPLRIYRNFKLCPKSTSKSNITDSPDANHCILSSWGMTTWTVDRQPRIVSVLFNCQESQRLENLSDQKEALALDNSEHPSIRTNREIETGFEGLQVSCNKTRYPIVWTWHLWAVVRFSVKILSPISFLTRTTNVISIF